MFGFWDKRDDRKNPYVRPNDTRKETSRQLETSSSKHSRPLSNKKSEVSERRTKVHVSEAGKEIGKTTMVKKLHDSSGFWTEKEEGNKSTLRLKKENFKTREEEEEESQRNEGNGYAHGYTHEPIDLKEMSENVDNLSSGLDKLNDEVDTISLKVQNMDHLIVRLNLLEEQQKQILEKLEVISKGFRCPCLSDNETSSSDEEPISDKDDNLQSSVTLRDSKDARDSKDSRDSRDSNEFKKLETSTTEITSTEIISTEITTPETSTSETSTSEITVPETIVPETIVPETSTTETITSEISTAGTIVPEISTTETIVPETSTPETSTPETSTPETIVPETSTPETSTPETSTPETSILETRTVLESSNDIQSSIVLADIPIGIPISAQIENKLPQLPTFKKLPPFIPFPLNK